MHISCLEPIWYSINREQLQQKNVGNNIKKAWQETIKSLSHYFKLHMNLSKLLARIKLKGHVVWKGISNGTIRKTSSKFPSKINKIKILSITTKLGSGMKFKLYHLHFGFKPSYHLNMLSLSKTSKKDFIN